jgi:photosystem II stability/assembly factor-like uncharacterized protein
MFQRRALALLVLTVPLTASSAPPTVDELVAHHIDALGGAAAVKAIRSLRMTGHIESGALRMDYGEVDARPSLHRDETTIQGLTVVSAWDGTEGWSMSPWGGRREPERMAADDAKTLAQNADFEGTLVDWKQKGHQVEYLGTEDVDGTRAHKLRVVRKDGDIETLYLDPEAYLLIRKTMQTMTRGVETVFEIDYGSYQKVAGVYFPFTVDLGPKGGRKNQHFIYERIEANVDLDPAQFHYPAAGAKIVRVIAPGPGQPVAAEARPPVAGGSTPTLDAGILSGLGARNIGSAAMSGRIAAIAARADGGKTTLFVGAASGGVWKSIDGGTTFKPVFDDQPVQSIGAIAIDPSNPKNVWVGTGEGWTRNSTSIGNGIYKSTDGGENWTNMGLPDSERITRIVVHPKNSDVVYACVPGKLWSDSPDRGLYKTSDGGKSWSLILKGANLSTGCSSVSLDPKNPEALLVGMWDFRRKGWTFRSGGDGPDAASGSGLYASLDGGKTFTALDEKSRKGLPPAPWGRVEVVHAPSDGKVVYAFIESKDSALFRSADGGQTWEKRDKSQWMVWRPFYFSRLVIDPTNPDRLFKPDGALVVSEDGGRSFTYAGGSSHGDWHDMWIEPGHPQHIIGGDDGGLWISWDGGNRWWKGNNLPISQFYHVAVDNKDPYQVYGGLQDNSSWVGDSSYPGGISNQRWENLYYGDGFWVQPDPSDPNFVYAESQGGNIGRIDRRTLAKRNIQPMPSYKEKLRWNWNTPIAVSPTQKGVLYIGAQFLFRSKDHGETWERISPDLTSNDPEKQKQEQSGGVTVDNSSAEMHTTIFAIAESPRDARTIWAGTDDGNLQLTRDGGKTWTNVVANVPGLPASSWVSWVEASRHDPAVAYAAFDRHTFGDMTPWVYRTGDFGKSWTRLVGPEQGVRGYAHVIREDSVKPALLYLGTELGLWISVDGGKGWAEFKGSRFPSVAVRDLALQDREGDLVIATHGRGIWILDDLAALRALTPDVLGKTAAFLPARPSQQRMPSGGGWADGDAVYAGEGAPDGAMITFYQRSRHLFGPIQLEIVGPDGKVVDTLAAPPRRGLNRVPWAMTLKPPRVPSAAQLANEATVGPRVPPGLYTARLTKGGEKFETPITVQVDRRAPYNAADRKANFDAVVKAGALFDEMSALVDRLDAARAGAAAAQAKVPAGDPLASKLGALATRLDEIKRVIVATKEGGGITGEERIREHLADVYGALRFWEGRPAKYKLDRIESLRKELDDVKKDFDTVASRDLPAINDALKQKGLPPVPTTARLESHEQGGDPRVEACLRSRGAHCDVDAVARQREADRD